MPTLKGTVHTVMMVKVAVEQEVRVRITAPLPPVSIAPHTSLPLPTVQSPAEVTYILSF